jgi:hypothetical protein
MKSYAIVITLLLGGAPALAANADAPQANVDKHNDAGNSTGNDKVDTLNRGQLDANQKPPATAASTPAAPAPAAAPTAK